MMILVILFTKERIILVYILYLPNFGCTNSNLKMLNLPAKFFLLHFDFIALMSCRSAIFDWLCLFVHYIQETDSY